MDASEVAKFAQIKLQDIRTSASANQVMIGQSLGEKWTAQTVNFRHRKHLLKTLVTGIHSRDLSPRARIDADAVKEGSSQPSIVPSVQAARINAYVEEANEGRVKQRGPPIAQATETPWR
jgi:hypothetical protein